MDFGLNSNPRIDQKRLFDQFWTKIVDQEEDQTEHAFA